MKKRVYNIAKDKNRKKYVYPRMNDKGYTLIEAMISFTIFIMISISIPLVMKCFSTIKQDMVPPHYYEWNLFNESLRNELWGGRNVLVTSDKISFTLNNKRISYEKYQGSVRRRVDQKGHEVVLQSVKAFKFSPVRKGVHMDVEFEGDEKAEAALYYFSEGAVP
ncbi:competence type IV pilus minor pilin ComGF [Bacillus sp. KH172YL63]|uniref:competence type IV pilus minor pilin ComGF n=1 Tax=Bacillus sp. KH172YL63 TaxID=2709784 RepID=UPI0013E445D8|nr:competence type IV pilus minor pilin ComGF [Bacillus sp. KH172YL63]BCB04716.1 hypothetical protein KH172YL63_28490 [Bacillus sp. KH172YL63]